MDQKVLFEELEISDAIKKAVSEIGFVHATPIQAKSIPYILDGKDVIGRSQTGTGKTAAFGIPAIELVDSTAKNKVQVLVLCPTRELAMQAGEEIVKFAKYVSHIKVATIYGGASMERQISQLKGGANIVIGTPGRIMDHMRRKTLKLDSLKMVILDEADEMLNMGFREDIELILSAVPTERQTVLFSATMPPAILTITKEFQQDPIIVQVGDQNTPKTDIEQLYYDVPQARKKDALMLLLHAYEPKLSIIFCNTKLMVDELAEYLCAHGFLAAGIHGDMKQAARTQVMNRFKSGRIKILIATDVAARGIDVENVDAVFNYDIPQDTEYYIHRVGRTGRAGRTGTAYTLISGRKQYFQLRDIERLTKAKVTQKALPTKNDVLKQKRAAFLAELMLKCDSIDENHPAMQMLNTITESDDIDLKIVAAALLSSCYNENELNIPEIHASTESFSRSGGGSSVSGSGSARMGVGSAGVVLGIGRRQRVAPNFIVSSLAESTGLSGKAFGKIEIFDNHTVVHMSKENVALTTQMLDSIKINGFRTSVYEYTGGGDKKSSGPRRRSHTPQKRRPQR